MGKLKGSFTIEASFIIPIVIGVIVILLYLIFYVHDRCYLAAQAYQEAIWQCGTETGYMEEIQNQQLSGLIGTHKNQKEVQENRSGKTIQYQGSLQTPFPFIRQLSYQVEGKAAAVNPVKLIRYYRSLKQVMESEKK